MSQQPNQGNGLSIKEKTKAVARELPLQHTPGTFQFTCDCGVVVTFAENSKTYPMLTNRSHPGPGIVVGECPLCGAKHWKGRTRR